MTDLQQSDLRRYLVKLSEEKERFKIMVNANFVQRKGFTSQDWYEKKYVTKMGPFRFPVGRHAMQLDANNLFNRLLTVFQQTSSSTISSSSARRDKAHKQKDNETGSKRGREEVTQVLTTAKSSSLSNNNESTKESKILKKNNSQILIHSDNEEADSMEIEKRTITDAPPQGSATRDKIPSAHASTAPRVTSTQDHGTTLTDASYPKGTAS